MQFALWDLAFCLRRRAARSNVPMANVLQPALEIEDEVDETTIKLLVSNRLDVQTLRHRADPGSPLRQLPAKHIPHFSTRNVVPETRLIACLSRLSMLS